MDFSECFYFRSLLAYFSGKTRLSKQGPMFSPRWEINEGLLRQLSNAIPVLNTDSLRNRTIILLAHCHKCSFLTKLRIQPGNAAFHSCAGY